MPLILEANDSKKIGLPGYSSHQFMVTLRTETTELSTVQAKSERLYGLLQTAVDTSLQKVGYLPAGPQKTVSANGSSNGHSNGSGNGQNRWACSDKQRSLILKITDEHKLDKNAVEKLAAERFAEGHRKGRHRVQAPRRAVHTRSSQLRRCAVEAQVLRHVVRGGREDQRATQCGNP